MPLSWFLSFCPMFVLYESSRLLVSYAWFLSCYIIHAMATLETVLCLIKSLSLAVEDGSTYSHTRCGVHCCLVFRWCCPFIHFVLATSEICVVYWYATCPFYFYNFLVHCAFSLRMQMHCSSYKGCNYFWDMSECYYQLTTCSSLESLHAIELRE